MKKKQDLKTIKEYAALCGISQAGVNQRFKKGMFKYFYHKTLKSSIGFPKKFVDINKYPPVSPMDTHGNPL